MSGSYGQEPSGAGARTYRARSGSECSLCLPDRRASRQHARFQSDGATLTVVDTRSSHGILVNQQRVSQAVLEAGDVVCIGETHLRVLVEGQALPSQREAAAGASLAGGVRPAFSPVAGPGQAEGAAEATFVLSVLEGPPRHADAAVSAARLEAVLAVSRALTDIRHPERLFGTVLESLFNVFPHADRGFLMLGGTLEELEPRALLQRDGSAAEDGPKISTSISRRALETASAVLYNRLDSDFAVGASVSALGIRSALAIPLVADAAVIGLLVVDSAAADRPFTADDLALAVAVSQQVSIALHNALLLKQVEKETTIRHNLSRFLPGPVVAQALAGEVNLALGGVRGHGTLLFSDVVGFTRLSELLEPEEVVALMNRYFARMVPCIHSTLGAIDKYMGDAIMAFWGIPFSNEQGAQDAARSALLMQTALSGLNSEHAIIGTAPLSMGIGLNSGPVVAGNIGAEQRVEYTVLGDTVNTAQRLEAAAAPTQVIVSAATRHELGARFHGIRMPPLKVKNKAQLLEVYSLRGLALESGAVLLHLPVKLGEHLALLAERSEDGGFALLHPSACDPAGRLLVSAVPEWPGIPFGAAEVMEVGERFEDGRLMRTLIRLADPTLGGLLGSEPLECGLGWEALPRSPPE